MKLAGKEDKGKSGIYMITNLANNKVYIGQSIDIWARINKGYTRSFPKNKCHNVYLQRAWNKYGEENFKYEVLEHILDNTKLNEREYYWINKYNATNRKFGYNIINKNNAVEKWDKINKERTLKSEENIPNYEMSLNDLKKRISDNNSIPVIQLDLEGNFINEWKSATDASKFFNVSSSSIYSVTSKNTTTSCGFVWVKKEEYMNGEFNIEKHYEIDKMKKPVVQLSINGKYIETYLSVIYASQKLGINSKNILTVCNGYTKSTHNYIFIYKEDYDMCGFDENKYRPLKPNGGKPRRVVQLTLNNKYINTYETIKKASEITNVSNITSACRGLQKNAGGFKWMYLEEYESLQIQNN